MNKFAQKGRFDGRTVGKGNAIGFFDGALGALVLGLLVVLGEGFNDGRSDGLVEDRRVDEGTLEEEWKPEGIVVRGDKVDGLLEGKRVGVG